MLKISEILKKNLLTATRYTKNKNVFFIDTNKGRYVIKPNSKNKYIYDYLKTRNFNYHPKILDDDELYVMTEYVEDVDIPKEQKMLDMIDLVGLLHYKTTHYKEITVDDYEQIYEDVTNNIEYLYSYYTDLITYIETKIYMSPSQYQLSLNISKLFAALSYSKKEIELWYEKIKKEKKQRLVVLHNNLGLEHFIESESPYLISWDKSKIGLPIFDLYKLYKKHFLDFDFTVILNQYESKYPLLDIEKQLFFILIALPDKVEFVDDEYLNTKNIVRMITCLNRTERLIFPKDPITSKS